jgi:hypothetical protein
MSGCSGLMSGCLRNCRPDTPEYAIAKGLEIDKLPLLDTFRTFIEDVAIENIRLNQLILQY